MVQLDNSGLLEISSLRIINLCQYNQLPTSPTTFEEVFVLATPEIQ